ncbi:glycosyl transferase family 43 protein [Arabidopsis lyrata subsp. lyrata]|uniref:Glycosyltransferases n=1 Tax=Arabidopsis lyrata subsp. lyrata TaxID=81972 RepID=D7MKR9_ARALL|nr:glycosyl transferase family 43 protein [Arabidopsis lyrata subsp. lyrata]
MKLSVFRLSYWNRRGNSFRSSPSLDPTFDGKSPSSVFWFVIHGLCCLISLILGFRFSHLVLFFLFSTSVTNLYTTPFLSAGNGGVSQLLRLKPLETATNSTVKKNSRVVVGRHGIRIRPWPHPNPIEVLRAHQLLVRVQKEQKSMYGVRSPKTVIVVTPTYVRTFQALHLTGVMHSLMLVPYDLVWIVVEAGGITNETASFIAKSGLKTIHLGFDQKMPNTWEDRHKLKTKMRLHALRIVREKKLDGIVMFADDSNMHNELSSVLKKEEGKRKEKPSMPIQGPSCNSSEKLVGWHIFNTQPYAKKTAVYIDEKAAVMPIKMEWSGFVLNSRLLWKESVDEKPAWIKDLSLLDDNDEIDSPLSLVKDPSMLEPLGSCGRRVLLWWLRVEARADSKFPPGWIIKSPLEITVPSKRTPWPDSSSELPAAIKEAKSDTKPRGSNSKSSKGKQEPKAFNGVKVSTTS